MENQLTILSESLERKRQVLEKIQDYNRRQEQTFMSDAVDMTAFDAAVEEKGRLIDELNVLDQGFEVMYERLAGQLKDNREQYASQIRELQRQIAEIMEMSVTVQAQEKRNRQLIEGYFARERAGLREKRKTSKAAYSYYKKVNQTDYVQPQFMDNRK